MSLAPTTIWGTPFSPARLDELVAQTIPSIPDGKRGAMVGTVDANGTQVTVRMTLDDHWSIEGVAQRTWTGETNAAAKIVLSW